MAGKAKGRRAARLTPGTNGCHFLRVVEGKKVDQYHLTPLRTEIGGLAFRFAKLGGEVYSACAVPGGETHCDCKGHLHYGYCRHTAVLLAMRDAGKL
jgi:hypothetical protein